MWNSLESSNSKGWCDWSLDDVVRLLQKLQLRLRVISADQQPFKGSSHALSLPDLTSRVAGELKIVAVKRSHSGPLHPALLRIQESEDDGCLWRMRCLDGGLKLQVKRLLESDVE